MSRFQTNSLSGPLHDVAANAGHADPDSPEAKPRLGFFTDTSICIGCKACEVACKEWNSVPDDGLQMLGMSYDNTGSLGANTWRHVAFIEQQRPLGFQEPGLEGTPTGESGIRESADIVQGAVQRLPDATRMGTHALDYQLGAAAARPPVDLGLPLTKPPGDNGSAEGRTEFRWLMASDVCKHCTHAGCLDVCPTGALFRTEFGTVVVQEDICNGCGYCVPACPYGVIDRREEDGRAWKCTLCYDRLKDDQTPACAQACPTESIQFGPLDELRERAAKRVEQLHSLGVSDARLYGESPDDGVGGDGAFFLLLDEPEVYGLPPDPVVPTSNLLQMWRQAGLAGAGLVAAVALAFVGAGQ
ncbi:MAG TPA: 4Fe-4S dicluster domain-containing protein [Frankiaceae bacterium]|nr:4Fe-4S dicluster domain-containing protein [Frankiaceae bacterium]